MKTINLEKIFYDNPHGEAKYGGDMCEPIWLMGRSTIVELMREACNQAIDICAENAEAGYKYCGKDPDVEPYVLKNSILDVKKQLV